MHHLCLGRPKTELRRVGYSPKGKHISQKFIKQVYLLLDTSMYLPKSYG